MKLNLFRPTKSPLALFKDLQIIIAAVCITIPVIFRACDTDKYYISNNNSHIKQENFIQGKNLYIGFKDTCGTIEVSFTANLICRDRLGFRKTLSDYENSSKSYLFGMLYAIAALLLIYNAVFHYINHSKLDISKKSYWYYIISGVSLLFVIIFPDFSNSDLHNFFSAIFFIGNFFCAAFLSTPNEQHAVRVLRKVLTVLVILLLAYLYYIRKVSILYLEWISLIFIAAHLIYSAKKSKAYPNY